MNTLLANGIGEFKKFEDEKPLAGIFLWKFNIEDIDVVVPGEVSERSAGFKRVVVPQFAHWNGYSLEFP